MDGGLSGSMQRSRISQTHEVKKEADKKVVGSQTKPDKSYATL
jgi:hypothetical protein